VTYLVAALEECRRSPAASTGAGATPFPRGQMREIHPKGQSLGDESTKMGHKRTVSTNLVTEISPFQGSKERPVRAVIFVDKCICVVI